MLQLTEAALISTSVEAILYGFCALMYILTFWILLRNENKRCPKYALMAVTAFLLVLTTAEMIVNIVRICQGFLDIAPSQSLAYFESVSETTFVIKSSLFNTQTLVLDAVVIYRAWVVWQNDWKVVLFPIIGWLGLLACSIANNVVLATASENPGDVFVQQTGRWITAVYSMTLVTNLSATSLLAYRIWKINKSTTPWRTTDKLSPVLRVVIESGALYSLTIIAAIITFALKTPGVYVLLDMISPIISIVYNMIIIRIGLTSNRILAGSSSAVGNSNSTHDSFPPSPTRSHQQRASGAHLPFHLGWLHSSEGGGGGREGGGRGKGMVRTHEMKALAVEITKYEETDRDTLREYAEAEERERTKGSLGEGLRVVV
ncbi:hypothetical protein BDY19DRAFT_622471 [Irpex rosettiformis]|uniref:Uncharacterized protein n=1 Tax=Irpex rosettiformis TaxID=378272 RepID=A0ACB8UAV8_9APHY|nr:hypothetical protein BDY19DRAFT_622471 [Irpex rosettiformis]